MTELTITVRDRDIATLDELAEQQWRDRAQQASALLEAALGNARQKANAPERSRPSRTRQPRPTTNGVAVGAH